MHHPLHWLDRQWWHWGHKWLSIFSSPRFSLYTKSAPIPRFALGSELILTARATRGAGGGVEVLLLEVALLRGIFERGESGGRGRGERTIRVWGLWGGCARGACLQHGGWLALWGVPGVTVTYTAIRGGVTWDFRATPALLVQLHGRKVEHLVKLGRECTPVTCRT